MQDNANGPRATSQLARLVHNAGRLVSGSVLGGLLGLCATLLAARHLGPTAFGLIAIVMTYTAMADRLINFQTWQALIRYGAVPERAGDWAGFGRLARICALFDGASALVGTAVAALGAGLMVQLAGVEPERAPEIAGWAALYALVIATNLTGMPTAVLRMRDRFGLLAFIEFSRGAILFVAVLLAVTLDAGPGGMLAAFGIGQAAGQLLLLGAGWRELAGLSIAKRPRLGDLAAMPRGFPGFVVWTNVESSVKILREIDVFVVNALLGLEALGLYYAAKRIATAANGVLAPFAYALSPDFARLAAAGDRVGLARLLQTGSATTAAVAAALFLGFLIFGEATLVLLLGEPYRAATLATAICLGGLVIWGASLPLSPAMFSLGLVRQAFLVHLASAFAYLAALWPLVAFAGLTGAAAGYAGFFLIWAGLAAAVIFRHGRATGGSAAEGHEDGS